MQNIRKITRAVAGLSLIFSLPVAAANHTILPNFDPSLDTVKPAQSIPYININPAIQFGSAWGDFGKTEHGTFGKFPANFQTPFHTHSGAYHGVVINGTMSNPFKGEKNPPAMNPGSYWFVPANSVHATACISAEPCQFYFHAASNFDFVEHK
jgi:hypothetical protein